MNSITYPMRRSVPIVACALLKRNITYTCYGHTRNHTPIQNPLYFELKKLCKESINSNPLLYEAFENVDYQTIKTITDNKAQQEITKINDTQKQINQIIQKILETNVKS